MSKSKYPTAIDAIIFNEKDELLLVNKKGKWILPWGKQVLGEFASETLQRELAQELNAKLDENSIKEYRTFYGTTPFSWLPIEVRTYFAQLEETGEYIKPSSEIVDAKFTKNFDEIELTSITQDIIEILKRDWYIQESTPDSL